MVAAEDVTAGPDPEEIANHTFSTHFRGYDTGEVRAYLTELAEAQRALIAKAEAAESQAAQIIDAAENRAAEVLREAQDEAKRILASVAGEREKGFAEGASRAEAVLAEAEANRLKVEDKARAEGERLVAEAKAARERVLTDLKRRRKQARAQVEQLHAAREKLLAALVDVRTSVDVTVRGLRDSLPEAKQAADAAARRVQAEDDPTIEQLEAEIDSLKLAGLSLVGPTASATADAPSSDEPAPAVESQSQRSAVKIVRPMRSQDPVTGLPEEEMQAIEAPDPEEAVRLVAPEEEPGAEASVAEEPAVEDEPAGAEEPVADEEPAAEDQVAAADDEPAVEGPKDTPPSEGRPSPAAVDALFARLKADRGSRTSPAETVPEVQPGGGDERAELLARRDSAVAPATASLGRRFKRLLADEQNELLDAIRRGGTEGVLPSPTEHDARWAEAASADLALAAAAGAAFPGHGGDRPAEPAPEDLVEVAEAVADAVARPLRERLAAAIEGADGDADIAADAVRATYRTWRSERLTPAAAHAVLDAFSVGISAAIGAGTPVSWVVDDGGVPCPDAEDNSLAGVLPCGERFPTGHVRPPAHPGCRCLLVRASGDAGTGSS